jgi:hypothetical protein
LESPDNLKEYTLFSLFPTELLLKTNFALYKIFERKNNQDGSFVFSQMISEVLQSITPFSVFCGSASFQEFALPGLEVEDFGQLFFPITEQMAQDLLKVSTKIQSYFQIDAHRIRFQNSFWQEGFLNFLVEKAKSLLSLEGKQVICSFDKLLISEKETFFQVIFLKKNNSFFKKNVFRCKERKKIPQF